MEKSKLEFLGTIILPQFTGVISYADAFYKAGIAPSRLFKTMFLDGLIVNLPETIADCHRAVNRIDNLDLEMIMGGNFQALNPADIWRLFSLSISSEIKFKTNGACNMVLIANDSQKIWQAQIFNSRHAGWKAELYHEPRLFYDELVFSGHAE